MKQYSKLFSLVALFGAASSMIHADDNNRVLPQLQWRSQGRDTARKLYGQTAFAIYQPEMDGFYGTFDVTVQYDRSFRNNSITECLFGPALIENVNTATGTTTTPTTTNTNNCNKACSDTTIVISGLNVATPAGATTNRGPRELMAENFILPRDFRSAISFNPKVQDVVVNFDLFFGLDRWLGGAYFRLYGPVVWNKVSLNPSETILNTPTASVRDATTGVVTTLGGGYEQGFFDVRAAVPTQALFPNALSYFGGCTYPDKYNVGAAPATSVTVQPLKFAKFSDCPVPSTTSTNNCNNDCNSNSHHKTGFAELRGELGYNYMTECCRFLINLQAAAPTGSKVKAEYLLPAYVGNGHHWELGVGLGGAWRMWSSEDAEKSFSFIVEADITHLFNAKQQRTFDLKCKPLSRYMLAEQLVTPTAIADQLQPNTPVFSIDNGVYAPVANFSTRDVKVSIGVQGDLVAMFNYSCCGFSWDLGYNFWAMSGSKIKLSDSCDNECGIVAFPTNFALKGDASVGGYSPANSTQAAPPAELFGLGATETGTATTTGATIFGGVGTGLNVTNANVDNFFPAVGSDATVTPAAPIPLFAFNNAARINTSNPPVFISINDLDIEGAEQRGLSHKVFTHFSYTWRDRWERWVPYVGFGASGEFGSHHGHDDCPTTTTTTTPECDTCPGSMSCALSKWAVEIKGGVSFH